MSRELHDELQMFGYYYIRQSIKLHLKVRFVQAALANEMNDTNRKSRSELCEGNRRMAV